MSNNNLDALFNSIPCSGVGLSPKIKMTDKEYKIYTDYNKEIMEAIKTEVEKTLLDRFICAVWW